MPLKVQPDHKAIKGTSLMGGGMESGSPCVVECHNGKITRIRPLDYAEQFGEEKLNEERWEIEAHGKKFGPAAKTTLSHFGLTYKKRVYSENRVRYPLKRVDWDPNGERNPQNRGISKYERISWEEAIKLAAGELKRIRDTYGMGALLCQSDGHGEGKKMAPCHGIPPRLFGMLGPYTLQERNLDSWEGWHLGARHVWGCEPVGEMMPFANLYPDIANNADAVLFWGCDVETTPLGVVGHMPSRLCYWFTQIGLDSIYICPDLNYGAAVHADKWIPILPNTDAALQLAIAYVWLTEGTYDKEYVASHTYGFDKFADYVLGKEDGVPKTPEWASEKCAVPEWTIKALAREWGAKTMSICHGNGGSYVRGPFASEPGRLEPMLLGMQGLGKPGVHQGKLIEWDFGPATRDFPLPYQPEKKYNFCPINLQPMPAQGDIDDDFLLMTKELTPEQAERSPELAWMMKFPGLPGATIPRCMIHRAILEDHIEWYGMQVHPNRQLPGPDGNLAPTNKYQFRKIEFPRPGMPRLHMIWTDVPCNTTCWNDGNSIIKAMRSPEIECVVAQHPWLENDCYFADLILPVITKHETVDIGDDYSSGTYCSVYYEDKACDPIGESLSDLQIIALVAREFGDEFFRKFAGHCTDDELLEMMYAASGIGQDLNIDWEEFRSGKALLLPRKKNALDVPVGLSEFARDPKSAPLTTPTGLLEFSSSDIEKYMPDDTERPPVPHWVEKGPAHDERLSSERTKDYPLLCMSNHGHWRMHAQLDDVTWAREVETMKIRGEDGYQYEPCWLSPREAEKRGIKNGDIVKVFNERGIVLCGAYVSERIIDRAVSIDHGARLDPIIPGWLDRGGAINTITPMSNTSTNATGMATSGFLVEVAKVTDEEWAEWKRDYPEAFARKIDNATGVCLDGWLKK